MTARATLGIWRTLRGWAVHTFFAAGGGATLLALWTIWGRPGPPVLYGTDAAYYAQVAKELLARPAALWVAPTIVGEACYEHPPGGPYLLALVGWWRGGMTAASAVLAARLAATCLLFGCVGSASLLLGATGALGASLTLCCASGFLFESQNPMLEVFLSAAASLSLWASIAYADSRTRLVRGTALTGAALSAVLAFWCKGPVALLLLGPWGALSARGRLRAAQAVRLLASTFALGVSSVVLFEAARHRLHLPSFFATYGRHQLWPSMITGRHNPQADLLYYLPAWWRWYAAPLCLASATAGALVQGRLSQNARGAGGREHAGDAATTTFVVGLAWWGLVALAFAVMRQKYAWYVHAGAPGLALMGAAGAAKLGHSVSARRRGCSAAQLHVGLAGVCVVAAATAWASPATVRTARPLVDAMHAVPPELAAQLAGHRVSVAGEAASWRLQYLARFLWNATLVPSEAGPEVRLSLSEAYSPAQALPGRQLRGEPGS